MILDAGYACIFRLAKLRLAKAHVTVHPLRIYVLRLIVYNRKKKRLWGWFFGFFGKVSVDSHFDFALVFHELPCENIYENVIFQEPEPFQKLLLCELKCLFFSHFIHPLRLTKLNRIKKGIVRLPFLRQLFFHEFLRDID